MKSFKSKVLLNINKKTSSSSESLMGGMIMLMHTFPSFKLEDFYGHATKEPMSSPQFFALLNMAEYYNKKLNNSQDTKKWRK